MHDFINELKHADIATFTAYCIRRMNEKHRMVNTVRITKWLKNKAKERNKYREYFE